MNGVWKIVPLGEVADVFNGKTPSKAEQRSEGHPVLKIKDVSELGEYRGKFGSFVDHELAAKFSQKRVRAGDTLILNAAHNADYVASKTYHAQPPTFGALATGEWLIVRPGQKSLDTGFVHHWVTSTHTRRQLRELVNGIHLYPKDVARLRIPLPPLSEQRWIAEVLDRAGALRAKRRAALAELDSLTQSLFLDLFGDPVTNPKSWPSEAVAELCAPRANGCVGGPFGSDLTQADYVEFPGVPVVRGQNLSTNAPFLDEESFVFVSVEKAETLSRNGALRGDILVSQRGAKLAGQVALIPITSRFEKYIVSQSQMRISPDLNKVHPLYLVYYFRSPRAVQRMKARTISTGVPHINLGILREFLVEIPPIELQREFARRATAVEKLKVVQRASLAEMDVLFASLQHRAFQGEL